MTAKTPAAGANSQPATVSVTATFSEAVQPASISFILKDSSNNVVPATVSYNSANFTATLQPTSNLLAVRTYTATVSGVTDLAGNAMATPVAWSFSTGQPGFQESVIFSGLDTPTAFQFASDGRVFVAQKNGVILVYNTLNDTNPSVFADLRTNVFNNSNSGLIGMALDPQFPTVPYVYVLYTYDAPIGGTAPVYGTVGGSLDPCSSGACVVSGRLSRLQANGNFMTGSEQVLISDWYQHYNTQPTGNLAFGADGNLYASAGDGASATMVDVGQTDSPSPDPANEGGALRSQDLRSPPDPVTLDGSVIRVAPSSGQPVPEVTSMVTGTPTVDANGVKTYTVTSTFQGSSPLLVRVLEPTNPPQGVPRRFLYVLPVEAGLTSTSSQFGDGFDELQALNVTNRFNLTLIAPSFNYEPWYGDNQTDPTSWMESFIIRDLVPFGDSFAPAGTIPQRYVLGFSKSGNGALFLILRHPNVFSQAVAWDAPAQLNDINSFSALAQNFGTQANYNLYYIPTLVQNNAQPFQTLNRIWISGDQAAWTQDMITLHQQMTAAGIQHTWVQGGTRVHSWSSGWLDGAVTSMMANATANAPVDANEQRIIAYGLRSPRLAVRPGTQELWVADKGAGIEEINRIPNTTDGILENFGWPCYEGAGANSGYASTGICSLISQQINQVTSPYFSYSHQQPVVAGDEAGVGNGSISGLAFYGSGTYPSSYQGALFFSDYLRNNIWVMFAGASGLPDPTNKANFVLGAASPVDLKTGPGGDLFYADMNGGTIRRIRYSQPVVRSNGQPAGVLASGTTQTALSLTTDQNATCRYSTLPGVAYSSMTSTFTVTGGTSHSTTLTGLVSGGNYAYYVRCQDVSGNPNPDDYAITFSVAQTADTTPPVRSNGQPAGTLAAGSTQTTLTLTTNENATCRYSTTSGVTYASMTSTFSTTGALSHATVVSGLANGTTYNYYVRCQDSSGNANPDDFVISFSVGSPGASSSFTGVENPLSEGGMWDTPGSWSALRKNNGAYTVSLTSQARLVTPATGADQFSEITYDQDPAQGAWAGVTTRTQGTTNGSGYLAIAYAEQVVLYRTDDTGSLNFTQLAAASIDSGAAPRRLRMESQGANHRVYFNGVLMINYTASPSIYPSGQPGIAAAIFGGPTLKILTFTGGALASGADTTPPVRSSGAPTGTLAAGTTQTTLSLTTNEAATCRYATSAGVAYGSMTNTFSTTGGTSHSTAVTGLTNGGSYNYYVRCQDTSGNANPDDFAISFSVAQPVDTTPPVRSNGSPAGTLASGTTQTTLSLTTNENATCRYATATGVAYGSMTNTFSVTGGTSQSTTLTGLTNGTSYNYYVRCQDTSGNANTDDYAISFSVAQVVDTTPPVRSNGAPSGILAAGTTQTPLSLTTNENATCRYATTAGTAYSAMTSTFATTGGTSQSTTVSGLANGGSYTYYVRCQDTSGNANTDDFSIAFSIASGGSITSSFTGVENPLSEGGLWDKPGSWSALQKNNGAFTTSLTSQARLTTPVSSDQFSEITYDQDPGTASWAGVATRTQSTTNGSGYLAIAYSGQVILYRTDDSGALNFTQLASQTVSVGTAPRRLRLESQGNTHRVYFNGTLQITYNATGTVYTAGQPGIAAAIFGGPTVRILTFSGGTLSDTTPPVRSNGAPTGSLAAGTTQTTLSLTTNEAATCRYATSTGVAYGSMTNTFSTTGGTSQSTAVTGLTNGSSYNYYVRCQDTSGNANPDDYAISFSVAAADTTPPVRSNGSPAGTLASGTTQTTLSLTTNENATCRYSTAAGTLYGSMTNTFSTTGGTSQSTTVTGLSNGGSYKYYVRCQDTSGNANPDDYPISFSVAQAVDTTPPVRSNGSPTGILAAGTTQTSLSLTTNENATCRYATTAGTAYSAMTNTFATTGGTSQSTTVTGLANGTAYNYYVRCQDTSGNANTDDFAISFSVASSGSITSSFTGVENPLSEGGLWDKPGSWSALQKNNGAFTASGTAQARLTTPVTANQFSEITFDQNPGSSSWVGVATRTQGTTNGSGYLAIAYSGQVRLYRTDDTGGALNFTLLSSKTATLGTAPRRLRMESSGNTHKVYFNGTLLITYNATGTVYTTGQPGIAAAVFGGPTVNILTFSGGGL